MAEPNEYFNRQASVFEEVRRATLLQTAIEKIPFALLYDVILDADSKMTVHELVNCTFIERIMALQEMSTQESGAEKTCWTNEFPSHVIDLCHVIN